MVEIIVPISCVLFGAISFYLGYRSGITAGGMHEHYSILSIFESLRELNQSGMIEINVNDTTYRLHKDHKEIT